MHRAAGAGAVAASVSVAPVAVLLANLESAMSRGNERLGRLNRILATLAPDLGDASHPALAACTGALAQLGEELTQLQLAAAGLGVQSTLTGESKLGPMVVLDAWWAQRGMLTVLMSA